MADMQHSMADSLQKISSGMFGLGLEMKSIKQQTAYEHRVFTPSNACKSENGNEFIRIFSSLNLAYSSDLTSLVLSCEIISSEYPSFDFKWTSITTSDKKLDATDIDKKLERMSYEPLCMYLRNHSFSVVDVSDGAGCPSKNLFDSDIFTIRKGLDFSTTFLRSLGQAPIFIEEIRGRTDIIIVRDETIHEAFRHKCHVLIAIEIKTIAGFNSDVVCFREAATQLIGLNAENVVTSPCVILTNLTRKHYVFYLVLGENPAQNLSFKMCIEKCASFEVALQLSVRLSKREPFSMNFGRKPTPPPSTASDADLTE